MNIAKRFLNTSEIEGERIALVEKNGKEFSFLQLRERILKYAHGFKKAGIKPGEKVLVFLRPSVEFPSVIFALFSIGAVPVLMDPGMGKENLLKSIEDLRPDHLVAEPIVMLLKFLHRRSFQSIKTTTTKKSLLSFLADFSLSQFLKNEMPDYSGKVETNQLAAILFTSGGTGKPKGVMYTHDIFDHQTTLLQKMFGLTKNDVDFPAFPLFGLFTLCMGMKNIIPDMDPSKPAQCSPKKLTAQILKYQPTFLAGSPSIWERVATTKTIFPSVKYLVMFGAPVKHTLHQVLLSIVPNGNTFTPYGATECLPVSLIDGKTILSTGIDKMIEGKGTPLGKVVPETKIGILPISDHQFKGDVEKSLLEPNQVGEVVVFGKQVTPAYFGNPEETKKAKIFSEEGLWHRMGDLGKLDSEGNLWFLGRKSHRLETEAGLICPIAWENMIQNIPGVKRAAVIGAKKGQQTRAHLVILPEEKMNSEERSEIERQINQLKVKRDDFLLDSVIFREKFPVDGRHNIKIDRLQLSRDIFGERQ